MREMLPVVTRLWQGDYEHHGKYWSFPIGYRRAQARCRSRIRRSGLRRVMWPPLTGRSSRAPTFRQRRCHGQTARWRCSASASKRPLRANPGRPRPRFLMLRRTCVYKEPDGWMAPVQASIEYGRHFENLFKNIGAVRNGFPVPVDVSVIANRNEYEPSFIRENMMFGTPEEVVRKIRFYEACGVDTYCYGASFGVPLRRAAALARAFHRGGHAAFPQRGAGRHGLHRLGSNR